MATYTEVEVVQGIKNDWIVEAQTSDGGVRRTVFIDPDSEERAQQYAEILRSQHQLESRRVAK